MSKPVFTLKEIQEKSTDLLNKIKDSLDGNSNVVTLSVTAWLVGSHMKMIREHWNNSPGSVGISKEVVQAAVNASDAINELTAAALAAAVGPTIKEQAVEIMKESGMTPDDLKDELGPEWN